MDIDQEKRMAGDYEIIHALHIGDRAGGKPISAGG